MKRADILARLQPLAPIPTGIEARLRELPEVRAALFDIYGTLLISAAGEVLPDDDETALRGPGFPLPVRPLLPALREAIRREHARSPHPFPEIDIVALWAELIPGLENAETFALAADCALNPVWPMPSARAILTTLKESGLQLGLVSNAQRFTPFLLENLLGDSLSGLGFDPALCRYSWREGRAKPDSMLFASVRETLEDRGIRPEETLYIGNDVRNDIAPARACGFRTALFAGDARSLRWRGTSAENCGADLILTSLDQLAVCVSPLSSRR